MKLHYLMAVLPLFGALMCGGAPRLKTVAHVDLQKFMGSWYVIANIPTFVEKGAHNAVETYQLNPDGTIATTFTFHAGSFDGPLKRYNPKGFVVDNTTNAVWDMQFVWPFKSEYLIIHLADDYSLTVIGRSKLDYVWIMARTPRIPEKRYQTIIQSLAAVGYDTGRIQKVPQRWESANK
jgi:apolipoprotein D and lipocalin family protein